uniref:Uncharacterized protein n=1 Tax=Arundo donax TaxID=35708 RepID=A0A0A8YA69_ARUDO
MNNNYMGVGSFNEFSKRMCCDYLCGQICLRMRS